MFPEIESSSGGTIAWIITLSNRLKPFYIKPIHERMFLVPDLGMFELDEEFRYQCGKSLWYFYHQKSCRPIDIDAMMEITKYLKDQNPARRALSIFDLENYVPKFRLGEERKREVDKIMLDLEKEGVAQSQLLSGLLDGTLDHMAAKRVSAKVSAGKINLNLPGNRFTDHALKWINSYYGEDVVGRNYLYGRLLIEKRFNLRGSMPVMAIVPQRTLMRKNLALAVKGRQIEVDTSAKLKYRDRTELPYIQTKYDEFDITDNETVYRHGKTRVYFTVLKAKHAPEQVERAITA